MHEQCALAHHRVGVCDALIRVMHAIAIILNFTFRHIYTTMLMEDKIVR